MRLSRVLVGVSILSFVAIACSASGGDGGTTGVGGTQGLGGSSAAGGSSTGGSSAGGTGATGGSLATGGTGNVSVDAAGGTGGAGATGGVGGSPGVGGAGGSGAGCGNPPPPDQPMTDVCDGLDNDLNGFVDESCNCNLGATQPCFGGYPSQANSATCTKGTQACEGTNEFHGWGKCNGWQCGPPPANPEVCDNKADDDCDGLVDEGCGLNVEVQLDGDCLFAACPPQAPFPIGCTITMEGGDSRGCVSTATNDGRVFFEEGDACCLPPPFNFDCGRVFGTLKCSSVEGPPLNETNCPINKQQKIYPTAGGPDKYGCP